MNDDLYLRASAYLDDELSPRERAAVEDDPASMELVAELSELQSHMIDLRPDHTDKEQRIWAAMQAAGVQLSGPATAAGGDTDRGGDGDRDAQPQRPDAARAVTNGTHPDAGSDPDHTDRERNIDAASPPPSTPSNLVELRPSAHQPPPPSLDQAAQPRATPAATSAATRVGSKQRRRGFSTQWLGLAAAVVAIAVFGAVIANRGSGSSSMADSAADNSLAAMAPENGDEAMADATDASMNTSAGDEIANTPSDGGPIQALWDNPPELVGGSGLESFVVNVLDRVPTDVWPVLPMACTPLSPSGEPLQPVLPVNYQPTPGAPTVKAILAVLVSAGDGPRPFEVFAVDAADCSILGSATGKLT